MNSDDKNLTIRKTNEEDYNIHTARQLIVRGSPDKDITHNEFQIKKS